jgi:redox-sensitive bicupin YhaK (pirin superfamily)
MTLPVAKRVEARSHIPRKRRAAGLSIAQLHGEHLTGQLDPFLAIDHFEMALPFFPPHPHAGFSAVTYLFPQSQNGFVNRDSRGEALQIHPGDLHWTAAGSGVVHEEVPITRGVVCHGLQIFVNLHSSKKWMAPQALHLAAAQVPVVDAGGRACAWWPDATALQRRRSRRPRR